MIPPARHLYIHIPFCPAKCPYCAFVTHIGSLKLVGPYLEAVQAEMMRAARLSLAADLDTVYLGGGTPSLLTGEEIAVLLQRASSVFSLSPAVEITVEAQPSTVTPESLREYRDAGVTRLSFGVESLDTSTLAALRRGYDRAGVKRAVDTAREAGFEDISGDLIYGLPGQTAGRWAEDLETLLALELPHISLYPLSVEAGTEYALLQRRGRLRVPEEETVVGMYETACELLRGAGYEHYELANWARPGHRCRHNLAYWRRVPYLGVGVGAHSYLPPFRTENISGVKRYIGIMESGEDPAARLDPLGPQSALAEGAALGLRLLADGLDLSQLAESERVDIQALYGGDVDRLIAEGALQQRGANVRLCERLALVGNEIWGRFIPSL